ncbi:MAG: hypothetical protein U9N04_04925 [Patescibacteria group bacterium]|nr:hypothetical protein [Patescibacteria group bacterium]
MKIFSKKQNKNGFSIIEVIVATGIITIGIIPIIALFNQNLKSEIRNKNVLIATYLTNESIEIVRQKRDNNWSAGVDWMTDIPTGDVIVGLDNNNDIRTGWEVVTPGSIGYRKIYLSDDDSYVQCDNSSLGSWTETPFERYLTIDTGAGTSGCLAGHEDDCMRITSYVLFGGTQIVEVTAYLYDDWK